MSVRLLLSSVLALVGVATVAYGLSGFSGYGYVDAGGGRINFGFSDDERLLIVAGAIIACGGFLWRGWPKA